MLLGSATEFHASIWASHGNELRALAGVSLGYATGLVRRSGCVLAGRLESSQASGEGVP